MSLTLGEVYPPSDPLAVDRLRLMVIHDDLAFVGDWIRAHLRPPKDELATLIAASRFFFLKRLFSATVLHEGRSGLVWKECAWL